MAQAVLLTAGMALLFGSALTQRRPRRPGQHRLHGEGYGMPAFILLGLGIIEMTLKTISGFTDPKWLQVTIDFVCLALLAFGIFLYSRRRPRQPGTRGRP